MAQDTNVTLDPRNCWILGVVVEPADTDGVSAISRESVTLCFVVITSLGTVREARLADCEYVTSDGGRRCIEGNLEIEGDDLGRGIYYTDDAKGESYCCFYIPL